MSQAPLSPIPPQANPPRPNDPLGDLPRVSARELRLERRLRSWTTTLKSALDWLSTTLGEPLILGPPEVRDRASGLKRPGVIAQVSQPSTGLRLGVGAETVLVHALVDHLLGFDRHPGEERLQVTPVEWGIFTMVLARTLAELSVHRTGPPLLLDRVGPEPFDPTGLGPLLTILWPIQVGATTGLVRLWIPDSVDPETRWPAPPEPDPARLLARVSGQSGIWRAEAGEVRLPRGLSRLRVGGVLPFHGPPPTGSPASPVLRVELALRDRDGRSWFDAEPVPQTGGGQIRLLSPLRRDRLPREPIPMSQPADPARQAPPPAPAEIPVTLVVELGRINLPVSQVADLQPGATLELGRHAREPVELTSNGRLVARGELVQIDNELGVRVTNVFL